MPRSKSTLHHLSFFASPLAALCAFFLLSAFGSKNPDEAESPGPTPSSSLSPRPSTETSPAVPPASPSPAPSVSPLSSASPAPAPSASAAPAPSPSTSGGPALRSERKLRPSPSPRAPKPVVPPPSSSLPEALQKAEAAYAASASFKAKFKQITFSVSTQQKRTSEGTLLVQRPDKIRWETLTPDRSLLVSNGTTAWFYTPPFDEGERGQVIERPAASTQSHLAQALLSGRFSLARDLRIEPLSSLSFKLTPLHKRAAPGIRSAEISLEPKSYRVRSVILQNTGGNRTEIELSEVELGGPVDRKLFEFQVPPNTDRLDPSAEKL